MSNLITKNLLINGTVSDTISINKNTLLGIYWPAGMASTSVIIHGSPTEKGLFRPIQDLDKNDYTISIANTASYSYINPIVLAGVNFIKFVLDSSETEKEIVMAYREI